MKSVEKKKKRFSHELMTSFSLIDFLGNNILTVFGKFELKERLDSSMPWIVK
jgi:hypothetical protein